MGGVAEQQAAAPTTTAPPPNAAACPAFAEANNDLVSLLTGGKGTTMTADQWKQAQKDAVRNIDRASLQARGAVKERIDTLVAQLPGDSIKLAFLDSPSGRSLVTNEDRVDNACQADGHPVTIKRPTLEGIGDVLGPKPGS